MLSDPFFGNIHFRNLINIQSGQKMAHKYVGSDVPFSVISALSPERQKQIREFDPSLYLAANPDLVSASVNPYEHFVKHGYRELRRLRP
jgi:hypothetical protein